MRVGHKNQIPALRPISKTAPKKIFNNVPEPTLIGLGEKHKQTGAEPACRGLHKLAILTGELQPDALAAVDFTNYRPGKNNRSLIGAIMRDLEKSFGAKVNLAYGNRCETEENRLVRIGEQELDKNLAKAKCHTPKDKKAVAAFVIAHEFFHAYLRHPEVAFGTRPDGFDVKKSGYRKIFELQVDYLAARYIQSRGLSLEPVHELFSQDFEASKNYPSGEERQSNILSAQEPEFRQDLFTNEIFDCLAFLDALTNLLK